MIDPAPLWLSFRLALTTTAILLLFAVPLANWLAHTRNRLRAAIEAAISLPLVLPPSVLGFYLLLAFSPSNAVGRFLEHHFNLRLVFSFPGLVIASLIYSLPFMVNPILSGLKGLPLSLRDASSTLGKSAFTTLLKVQLPNIRPSMLTGVVLSFAHTIGEFGVVLMIGGNIPGQTRVASLAIYDEVQSLHYHEANRYALLLFVFSFIILLTVYLVNQHSRKDNLSGYE
jgi:molybdate transport system permease protein